MSINYKGNFINQLYKAIEQNPDLTLGELLFSFLRESRLKKHYFYVTDEEIYNSLEKLNKTPAEEKEEKVGEKDLVVWIGKNVFKATEEELNEMMSIEEGEEDRQGFMFVLEQLTILKQ